METLITDSPRISILTKSVIVTITGFNAPHYAAQLGAAQKLGARICVVPSMLPKGSNIKLRCECPECGAWNIMPAYSVAKQGHTLCQPCRQREGAYGKYIGQTFGRLTITGFAPPTEDKPGGKRTKFTAICACGNATTIWGQALRKAIREGSISSCGCFTAERTREMGFANAGTANGMWRHDVTLEERHERKRLRKKILRTWSKGVRRRDGGKCVICGSTSAVESHHLSGVNTAIESSLTLENGVTLCRFHHQDFHCQFMGHVHAPVTPADFARYAATQQQSQPA